MIRRKFLITLFAGAAIAAVSACASATASTKPQYKFANFSNNFEEAKAAGYDGVQLNQSRKSEDDIGGFTKEQMATMKKQMKELNLKVCSVCVPCYHKFIFEEDKNCIPYMKNIIDQTAELGADDILIPFFGKSNLYEKEKVDGKSVFKKSRLAPLIARLKELAPYAASKGVTLSLENMLNPQDNVKIVDMVGEPNVKVYLDVLNIVNTGYEPDEAIKIIGKKYIHQIHLKANAEFFDEATKPKDLNKCFQAIVDSGYDGWLVLEQGTKRKVHTNPELIKHNLELFKKSVLCK